MVNDQLSQSRKVNTKEFMMSTNMLNDIHTEQAVMFTVLKKLEKVNVYTKGNGR